MNVLYIHGLGSSGSSNTPNTLREITNYTIFSPDIPHDPIDAIVFLKKYIIDNNINVIIGTSLGAFYAKFLDGPYKILVNPAMPYNIGNTKYGTHKYYNNRKNGEIYYCINEDFVNKLNLLENTYNKYFSNTITIFGKEDNVCNNIVYFKDKDVSIKEVEGMGHRINLNGFYIICDKLKDIEFYINKKGYLIL